MQLSGEMVWCHDLAAERSLGRQFSCFCFLLRRVTAGKRLIDGRFVAGDCCRARAAGLGLGSLWAGEGNAQPPDGSTQGMSNAHQTHPECCHCGTEGDGCHWAQLPKQCVSLSATCHGQMRWHLAMTCSMAAQDGGMDMVWEFAP